ncbi:10868_t:CDS:2 [Ambispora gerdemannii]|uniref:10868_t:CDS:1 n=1 Tax=Ambispora gerdemannii TaxID=144530 RepID=A0A9N9CUQ3_9GLOM|nr:10868_t:CDS:2 [Ambispora gerdemannii]
MKNVLYYIDISNFIENEVVDLENIEEFNNIEEDNYELETELASSSISEIESTISETQSNIPCLELQE